MAAHRVAASRSRTDEVLALDSARQHQASGSGAAGQAALDHRTRLSGAETRARLGALRRTRLARVSPPRYPLYRGLWFPGGRTEPFFPLGAHWSSGAIRSPHTAALPPSGLVPCARSGIIPGLLQLCARSLPGFCFGNYRVALFVELPFYNTVVLTGLR